MVWVSARWMFMDGPGSGTQDQVLTGFLAVSPKEPEREMRNQGTWTSFFVGRAA